MRSVRVNNSRLYQWKLWSKTMEEESDEAIREKEGRLVEM